MATETSLVLRRTRGRLHHRDLLPPRVLAALALATLPTAASSTSCGSVHFVHPAPDITVFQHNTINVTYESDFAHPSLVCLCGQGGRVSEKFRLDNAAPFAASEAVLLDFCSADPCWFHLEPGPAECGDPDADAHDTRDSPTFALLPRHHHHRHRLHSQHPITRRAPTTTTTTPPSLPGGRPGLSPGATAGIGAGVAAALLAAMAAFLYFRRRKKHQTADLADAIIDHDRRHGRRPQPPEKDTGWDTASSATTTRYDEPSYPPPQPIPDGFPGSMGYDDVRSLHSLHPSDTHSPTAGPPAPSHTHAAAGYWTERDELSAARLKSQIPVTSYGPNPVTPTLTPRASSRVDLNIRAGSVSTDSRENIPPMPLIPLMPDYSYTPSRRDPSPSHHPQKPTPPPLVVSYGPNRVTPNPSLPTPTVPPDEAVYKRSKGPHFELHTIPASRSRGRGDAWDDDDDDRPAMTASAMGPLPPYASTADFYAMEKGAIRKMAEPMAEAELPPTKDGYYHGYGYGGGSEVVEYELQAGGGTQIRRRREGLPGERPGARGRVGGREMDEGKFLLSPELVLLKGEKMKLRAGGAGNGEGSSGRGKNGEGRGEGRGTSVDGRGVGMDGRLQ